MSERARHREKLVKQLPLEKAPTLRPDEADPNKTSQEIEQARGITGCGILAVLGFSLALSGSVGTIGYLYINEKPPFAPDETAETKSQNDTDSEKDKSNDSSEDKPVMPEKIYSNQDLKTAMNLNNVAATSDDFDFETNRPELQAKALLFRPLPNADATDEIQYQWLPVRERITRTTQTELLVAIKIINPYIMDNAYELIVPEGLSYRARTVDPNDPATMYFYYSCEDKKGAQAMLAQIGIKNPSRPKSLMWARSFNIPSCD